MTFLSFFKLKKQAELLDSKAFIIKAFFAVLTAYFIASNSPLISKDMISVLFGLMLTLEAVTLTGIRYGMDQVYASLLGAASTAIIISLFGINMFTIALSMSFTMYVCLKINWREVSPVAMFTSIYMTQYIQLDSAGNPSVWNTAILRFSALLTGILVAILFNFIFSFIFYRSIASKRIVFILNDLKRRIIEIRNSIDSMDKNQRFNYQLDLAGTFNNIDWISKILIDRKKELNFLKKVLPVKEDINDVNIEIMKKLRSICHFIFDINHELLKQENDFDENKKKEIRISEEKALYLIDFISSMIIDKTSSPLKPDTLLIIENGNRILNNFQNIHLELYSIYDSLCTMHSKREE